MIRSLNNLIVIVIIFVIGSCGVKNNELESSKFKHYNRTQISNNEVDASWFMSVPKSVDHFKMRTHGKDSLLEFSYPSNWRVVDNPNYQFAASLDTTDVNQFVVVLRFSKIKSQIKNLEMYFDEVYTQFSNDTFETMTEFNFYEVAFKSTNSILFGNLGTKMISENYVALASYFEDDEYVYDITMKKSSNSFANQDYLDFLIFLKSLQEKGKQKINLAELNNIYRLELKKEE